VTELAALRAALSAEQAVVYGYGILGARTRGGDRRRSRSALNAHLVIRDRLIALITAAGANPPAAQPAYRLGIAVTDRASARELGARLEQGSAGAAWDLIAASGPGTAVRAAAISWLADAAMRGESWGARQALPGQPS